MRHETVGTYRPNKRHFARRLRSLPSGSWRLRPPIVACSTAASDAAGKALGGLLLSQSSDNQPEAEAGFCFHQALSVARNQHVKSWELRAATSLARLWQSQDKRQDAYDLLAPVYNWFTEGFDTADLQDAKALLDELA